MKNLSQPQHTAESIFALVSQFQVIRVLFTAYELEIFTVIGETEKNSRQIAGKILADARATDRLLNALCAQGFLFKRKNLFSNTPFSLRYLVKNKPGYMAGLMHQVHLWDSWTTLTNSVKKGTSVFSRPEKENGGQSKWLDAFISAMHYRAKDSASAIAGKIDLHGVKRVLDVGGGSGVFAMAIARTAKDISATVFDLPDVVPITQKFLRKEKMSGRINTVSGNFNKDPLPKGYDLVLLSAIIHSNSYQENANLIKKCAASLHPKGQMVIQDYVMDETRTHPVRGTLFALNMLVGTRAGDTFTETEIKEWFTHAGIRLEKSIEAFNGNSLMIGRKIK